jgi:hypothetical protein
MWSKYVYNQHRIRSLILNLCQTLSNTKECPFYIKGSQRHFSETVRLYPAKYLHTNTLKDTFKPERFHEKIMCGMFAGIVGSIIGTPFDR